MTSNDIIRVTLAMPLSELKDRIAHITIDAAAVGCVRDFGEVEKVTVTQTQVREVDWASGRFQA